jgi:hypothetical protein
MQVDRSHLKLLDTLQMKKVVSNIILCQLNGRPSDELRELLDHLDIVADRGAGVAFQL